MTVSVDGLSTAPFLMAQREAPSASSNTRESIAPTTSSLQAAAVSDVFDATATSTTATFDSTALSTADTVAAGTTGSRLAAEVKPEVNPAVASTATAKTSLDLGTRIVDFAKFFSKPGSCA